MGKDLGPSQRRKRHRRIIRVGCPCWRNPWPDGLGGSGGQCCREGQLRSGGLAFTPQWLWVAAPLTLTEPLVAALSRLRLLAAPVSWELLQLTQGTGLPAHMFHAPLWEGSQIFASKLDCVPLDVAPFSRRFRSIVPPHSSVCCGIRFSAGENSQMAS